MGIFRFWLAFCVLVFHTSALPVKVLDSFLAVQTFFLLSGFYMAMVIYDKYQLLPRGWLTFYQNRALRIYPLYWLTLLATFLLCLSVLKNFSFNPLNHYNQNIVVSLIHNVSLIGSFDTVNPYAAPVPFIVLQAWTLQVEGMFYLLAPWLSLLAWPWLIAGIFFSFLSRTLTYNYHVFGIETIDHRFFPNQLIFFLLGVLAFRLFIKVRNLHLPSTISLMSICFLTLVTLIQPYAVQMISSKLITWGYLVIIMLITPLVFQISRSSRLDSYSGKLAYPLYLVHLPIAWVLKSRFEISTFITSPWYVLTTLVLSLLISILIVRIIESPIDRLKHAKLTI